MIVQDIITNKIIHWLFVRPYLKNGILKTRYGFIDLSCQHKFIQSLIFWNVYERKEIAAIKKHLDRNLDLVEMGSSIGLVSMSLGKILRGRKNKFISVEANPRLIGNLSRSAGLNNYNITFINAAICYSADSVNFQVDDRNLGSKITEKKNENTTIVNATTLGKLVVENGIGRYALICDIEGAESQIIADEMNLKAINCCEQIIIELHDTTYKNIRYSKEMLAALIVKKFSMQVIFSADDIWVFQKIEGGRL